MLSLALLLVVIIVLALAWLWRARLLKDRLWFAAWALPVLAGAWLIALVVSNLEVTKAASQVLMPIGLLWVAMATLGLAAAVRRQWRQALAWAVVFLVYGALGNVWLGGWLVKTLENRVTAMPGPTLLKHFNAVIVLGGGTSLSPQGGPQFSDSGDRIALAARIYMQGKVDVLVTTGSTVPGLYGERSLADETRDLWGELGVAKDQIITASGPQTTHAEIAAIKALIAKHDWKEVAIISSAWHLQRVRALCARAGVEATLLPADWRGQSPPFSLYWCIPRAAGFHDVETACHEYLGMLVRR